MRWVRIGFWIVFLAASAACLGESYHKRFQSENLLAAEGQQAQADALHIQQTVILFSQRTVPARLPFAVLLENVGIDPGPAAKMIASAQPVFDLRHLRAGNTLAIGRSVLGELRDVRYRIDEDHLLDIAPSGPASGDFHSEIQTVPSHIETVGVGGTIQGSLFQSVVDAGEKPELAMQLANIFAFDLDFYTDPRPGDTFRVVVEKKVMSDGTPAAYGRVLAAEYVNGGHPYQAILFHDADGQPAYFQPNGQAMKRAFLHSPLKFAAPITSHFSLSRYHPILKEYRPHLGIDYGAPQGTPVQTIGEGRVIFAGPKGEDGNLVKIQHSNGFVTYYMHLSRILAHNGEHVPQGATIGLVGMTGLATGPHLDFRIEQRGQFLNFEKLKLPTADPVSKANWAQFAAARDSALADMPPAGGVGAVVAQNTSTH